MTDTAIRKVWIGGAVERIEDADLLHVPMWETRLEANKAARAINSVLRLSLKATLLSMQAR